MSLVSVLGCGTWFFPIEEQLYWHPSDQRIGESSPGYRSSNFCWWLGHQPALALLDRAVCWGNLGWHRLPSALRWNGSGASPGVCVTGAPWRGVEMRHAAAAQAMPGLTRLAWFPMLP